MSAATADVLAEAANVIRRNGWHQGSYCDASSQPYRDRSCCAYGAINLAANGRTPERISQPGEAALNALNRHLGISGEAEGSVADWNDKPDRTVEDVIAALEGAAAAERERAA